MSDLKNTLTHSTVIELRLRNHPGAMSHVCGLFSRRAFNLEAILCVPDSEGDGATSQAFVLVSDNPQLDQVEKQLVKLHDVLELRHRGDLTADFFRQVVARAR